MKNKFFETKMLAGILTCLIIAVPAWLLGKAFPIIGGPVFGILFGMILAFIRRPELLDSGIKFTSKYILQYSIIFLQELPVFCIFVMFNQMQTEPGTAHWPQGR